MYFLSQELPAFVLVAGDEWKWQGLGKALKVRAKLSWVVAHMLWTQSVCVNGSSGSADMG